MSYFLGVDGGQSHTTALIADGRGTIVGRGQAGASNHTRAPGGRERLERAVGESVGEALRRAGLLQSGKVGEFKFVSAHLAMTGEAEAKFEIVQRLLRAEHLVVGHDAPAALSGATAGGEGIIVLAGTGSVAYGEARGGRAARAGGHGYLFSDEGSAFAIARAALSSALRGEDRGRAEEALKAALLAHFKRESLKSIAEDFYAGSLSRDRLASFTARVDRLARNGNEAAREMLGRAANELAEMAEAVAIKLGMAQQRIPVSYGGGVFSSKFLLARFASAVAERLPQAEVAAPRFGPEIGALLLAYRNAGRKITERLLARIQGSESGIQS